MFRIRRRSSRLLVRGAVAVAASAVVLAVSGCGTTADTDAATVAGAAVSMNTVQAFATDLSTLGLAPGDIDADAASVPGDDFRSALMLAIERQAWLGEAERWGLDIDAGRADAEQRMDQILAQAPEQPSEQVRELLIDYFAAQTVLAQHFAEIDPQDDAVLRRLYDGIPRFWTRNCISVLVVAPEDSSQVEELLDDGMALDEIVEEVEQAGLAADPSRGCLPELQPIPDEIQDALDAVAAGSTTGPIDAVGGATPAVYFARSDGREQVSFDEAKPDLERLAQTVASQQQGAGPSAYIEIVIQSATIDPRFGTSVVGQPGQRGTTFAITPPPAPRLAMPDLVPATTGT